MPAPTFDDDLPVLSHAEACLRQRPLVYRDSTTYQITEMR
jgi:hypothetical protein